MTVIAAPRCAACDRPLDHPTQGTVCAGGRYDGLFPELGRPWFAAGFCVRLTRLLDLAETRPELFETE